MKLLPLTASVLALALFSAPAFAQEAAPAEQPAVDQPAAPAAEVAAVAIPEEVLALLNDARPLSEMSVEELATRAKQARSFSKMKELPDDVRQQLQDIAQAARREIAAREEQGAQPAAPLAQQPAPAEQPVTPEQPATAEQPAPAEQPVEKAVEAPVEQAPLVEQPAVTQAPTTVEIPADVAALLGDQRLPSEMTPEELNARLKAARQFSKDSSLPDNTRQQLADIAKATRGELMARQQQPGQEPAAPAAAEVAPPPPAVIEQAPTEPLPAPPPAVVEVPAQTLEPATPPAPAVDTAQSKKLDGNQGSPEAEAKAKAILDDTRTADKLSDEELKKRVDSIRDLMAGNELSRATEKSLRQRLRVEREILRDRVAQAEQATPKPGKPPGQAMPPKDDKYTVNIEIVLNDRRPSEELEIYELRRRLEVYRQAAYDQQYEAQQRAYWRAVLERDQYYLQQRLLRDRKERQAQLAARYDDAEFNIEVGIDLNSEGRDYDVYEAEVNDEELEDVLVAAPRVKPVRRYSVEEIENSAELRQSLPRVEIDTVRFGFNEAFVRAEEVSNLDRIAEILERVLSKHPREIFLIEGHTDAVGSDAANLELSRERAAAIKKALTTYYVIPAKNLKTVGYGERYLKVPTAEAEQENRRVSVSRATALIGQLGD